MVECPDWYQLLQQRLHYGKQPDLNKQATATTRRQTKLQTGPSQKVMASHDHVNTTKAAQSPRDQTDASGLNQSSTSGASRQARQKANGSEYFKKLLQNDRFR